MRRLFATLLLLSLSLSSAFAGAKPGLVRHNTDWNSPLLRGIDGWWEVLPHLAGGLTWYNAAGTVHGTLTNMDAGSGWQINKGPNWHGAIRFDGSNDYVSLGDNYNCTDTTCTWVLEIVGLGAAQAYLIAKRNVGTTTGGYFLRTSATGELTARVLATGGQSAGERTSTASLLTGRFHVAVVFVTDTVTLANNDVTIYINGKQDQGSRTDSAAGAHVTTTSDLRFGTTEDSSSPANVSMNNIRYYSRGLTALEIAGLYAESVQAEPPQASADADSLLGAIVIFLRRLPHVFQ